MTNFAEHLFCGSYVRHPLAGGFVYCCFARRSQAVQWSGRPLASRVGFQSKL